MAKPKKPAGGPPSAEPTPTSTPPATETPPAAETPPEETPPAPTPEEIQAQVDAIFSPVNSSVNARIQEEREKEADAPAPTEEDLPQTKAPEGGESERSEEPAAEQPAAEPEPQPATPPAGERFVPGTVTPAEVEATARRVAREEAEIMAADQPAPEVPHGTLDEGLSDAAQDQLVVLKKMAAINPAHRDLPTRQREFWKKEEKYRAQWEQANQGTMFDPNAADHAEFYRKNEPFVPLKDFKAAERSLIADEAEERAVNRVRREQEPRTRALELKEMERESAPAIADSMADAAEEVFAAAPQFKEAFKPKELTKAAMEKMEEINPALAQIAREEAEVTAVLVGELEKLDRLQGHYPVNTSKQHRLSNGQTIAPHAMLEAEFAETEAELLAKPESEQVRDGKKLIRFDHAMARAQRINSDPKLRPDQKNRAIEDLNKSYWWVQSGDVVKHIRTKKAARVGEFAQRFAKMDKAHAENTAANGHPKNGAPTAPEKPTTPSKPSGKAGLARGTSTASSSDVLDNAPSVRGDNKKREKEVVETIFG